MSNLLIFFPILKLLFYIKLIIVVLTLSAIQYHSKIACIIRIFTTKCLIPLVDTKLIGVHMREVSYYLFLRAFPKENLVLMHYILSAW